MPEPRVLTDEDLEREKECWDSPEYCPAHHCCGRFLATIEARTAQRDKLLEACKVALPCLHPELVGKMSRAATDVVHEKLLETIAEAEGKDA